MRLSGSLKEELELHLALVVDRGHGRHRRRCHVVVGEEDREVSDHLDALTIPTSLKLDRDSSRDAVQGELAPEDADGAGDGGGLRKDAIAIG